LYPYRRQLDTSTGGDFLAGVCHEHSTGNLFLEIG